MKTIFVNPKIIKKIQKKVNKLAARWDYPKDEIFQLWEMVATIELGMSEKTFYDKDGIIHDGWNGYQDYDNSDVDPRRAWGGFYRLEKNQMAGWSVYMIAQADNKEAQATRCTNAYGWWFHWEPVEMVWGYQGFQDFYTEDEAQQALAKLTNIKQSEIRYSDMSGCYQLKVATTRRKPALKHVWRERVAK